MFFLVRALFFALRRMDGRATEKIAKVIIGTFMIFRMMKREFAPKIYPTYCVIKWTAKRHKTNLGYELTSLRAFKILRFIT